MNLDKENVDFVDGIMCDIVILGLDSDVVTYTLDFFDVIFKMGEKFIKEGKMYIDIMDVDIMCMECM